MRIGIDGVVKRFGAVTAVDRAELTVEDGELFTLLGPSGCGKTTLLRLLAGFYQPDAGQIRFGDRVVSGLPPYERNIGMVFQNYALWPHMTVRANVAYGLRLRKLAPAEIEARLAEGLRKVNLVGFEARYPGQLSGGQQQRVALARALVLNPDILLLDEPLSNLDAKIRVQVRAEIRKLQQELAITTIYVTHDQEEALSLSDRVAVMKDGRVLQVGSRRSSTSARARASSPTSSAPTTWCRARCRSGGATSWSSTPRWAGSGRFPAAPWADAACSRSARRTSRSAPPVMAAAT